MATVAAEAVAEAAVRTTKSATLRYRRLQLRDRNGGGEEKEKRQQWLGQCLHQHCNPQRGVIKVPEWGIRLRKRQHLSNIMTDITLLHVCWLANSVMYHTL